MKINTLVIFGISILMLTLSGCSLTNNSDKKFDEHHGHDMENKAQQETATGIVSTLELLKPTIAVAITTGTVTYTSGTNGYLVQPVGGENLPAVVIIHERWGLNTHIKEMAEVIAMQGYRVLAVDLYKGQVATDMDQAKTLSSSIIQDEATENLLAAEQYMRKDSKKVASRGRCLGGKQSLELSMASDTLDATVVYYGRLPTDAEKIKTVNTPLLGIFAELDNGIPPSSVNDFQSQLNFLNKKNIDITIYTGANHAFANPTGKAFAQDATINAREKSVEFLKKNLQ